MQRLETPSYCLTAEEKLHVYEPAEDTFLLLDALELELDYIKKTRPTVCLEIGCGSGIISTFVSKHLISPEGKWPAVAVLSTDINPWALAATCRTASLNDTLLHCIRTNLVDAIKHRLAGCVDLLLFNPPYVPTDNVLESENYLAHAYNGGITGTATLSRLIPDVFNLLSTSGIFYVVALSSNNIERLLKIDDRLISSIVLERKCGIERLYVLKFQKNV